MPQDNQDKRWIDSMRMITLIGFLQILLLTLLLVQSSEAATDITVRPSVMVEYSVDPAYLMPGDEGTVTVTLKNAAELYSYYSAPQDKEFDLTAQVLEASLSGNGEVQVTSDAYYDVGLLGPGDTIDFTYSITVNKDAGDGISFLDFVFVGGGDMYDIKWKIPVNIDTTGIKLINSEISRDADYVVLDIANVRQNTINAVTIVPATDNVEFQPAQYFIGTMDSDEMFTIQFDIEPEDGVEQIGVRALFKNGNNWHESDIQTINVNNSRPPAIVKTGSNPFMVLGIVGSLFAIIIIIFVVMRKRRSSREEA